MSILPILISAVAAAIELVVGMLCLAFAAAPGWRALRWFAAIALSAAAFSFSNLAFVLPVSEATVVWAGRLNWLWASVHVSCWLAYSRVQVGEPIRRTDWVLGGALIAMGLAALIPNAAVLDAPLSVVQVESLGLAYRIPYTTVFGDLVMPALLAALAVTMSRYVRYARTGVDGARAHLVAFTVFYATAGLEVAVSLRLVGLPYVVDVGFIAIVLAVSGEMARRVTRSARQLTSLTENLEVEIEQRTRELVAARDALAESERHAALGRLAAGVGHEINNPLAYVLGNLASLRETPLTAEQLQVLDETREGAERVARVTRELQLFARPGRGATFRVTLPACPAERPDAAAPESPDTTACPVPSRRARVLVVDDEPMVAKAVRRTLRGSDVDIADGGHEALRMMRRGDGYDAVVCDLMMPGMSGIDLYEELQETDPEMARRVIFVTGGAVTERARLFLDRADIRWLAKPVEVAELRRWIDDLAVARGAGSAEGGDHRACA